MTFPSVSAQSRSPITPGNASRRVLFPLLPLSFLTLLALILRLLATHNDLWLDEILSLQIARNIASPWEILTAIHSDNNHYLNSLYLYLVRNSTSDSTFRYFSVACGTALIPAAYWLGAQHNKATALLLATLVAFSYPLIHFSSEARGYSGALLGTLLAFASLTRWLQQRSWTTGLIYALSLCFAILSHLTACLVWLPLALGSMLILLTNKPRVRPLLSWLLLNLPPAATLLTLYMLDLRYLIPLGGPPMTLAHGIARLLALALGWPARDALSILLFAVPLVLLIAWQLNTFRRQHNPLWPLLTLILLTPIACAFVFQPSFFSPRYFLVEVPFLYLTIALLLTRLSLTRTTQMLSVGVLVLFITAQSRLYIHFLAEGRGQFTTALQFIAAHTQGPFINIASSQDFRATVELSYFAPKTLGRSRPISYIRQNDQSFFSPDWYILHAEGYDPEGPSTLSFPDQPPWFRVAWFPASELSGQAWTLYSHHPLDPNPSAFPK